MADNFDVTPGSGKTVATDDIGGINYQRVKLSLGADGTAVDAVAGAGAVGTGVQRVTLASDDPVAAVLGAIGDAAWSGSGNGTVDALLKAIAGQALSTAASLVKGYGFDVVATITGTAGAYSAGDIVGGLLSLSVAQANDEAVIINEIQISSKVAVTPNWDLVIFTADPTNTTKTDNAVYSLAAADAFKVRRTLVAADFTLYSHGTPKSWVAKNLNIVCKPASGSQIIYALLIDRTGITLSTTTDLQIRMAGVGA